jgi:hypothetical protein
MARRRQALKHRQLLNKHRKEYDRLLKAQGGGCAICGRPPSDKRRLDLDHDHKLMFIRGLLCVRCNRVLASWITAEWLLKAAEYLARGNHLGLD